MKKILLKILAVIILLVIAWFAFVYYVPYSKGTRSGELIKISQRGVIFKTWEGEISQGISGAQIFSFSILDKDQDIIDQLNEYQGKYVKLDYVERYGSFVFWGDTKYFITKVVEETSPHKRE
jgi:uncharacterized protein YxeA